MILRFLLVLLLLVLPAGADAWLVQGGSGAEPCSGFAIDCVAAPSACYSMRACSLALRGTAAVNVCNVADVACVDFSTDATTGNLVVTTVGGSSCSVITCTIKIWYDQSAGAGNVTQATIANRPTLTVSCLNSLPCAVFVRASSQKMATAGNIVFANPLTESGVAIRTGTFTSVNDIASVQTEQFGFWNTTNTAVEFGTSALTGTAADSAWHSIQAAAVLGGGDLYVDGTHTASGVGLSGGSKPITIGCDGTGTNFLDGKITEVVLYPIGFSAGQAASMNNNQHNYWNF